MSTRIRTTNTAAWDQTKKPVAAAVIGASRLEPRRELFGSFSPTGDLPPSTRGSRYLITASSLLDGVNASSLGLMAAVTFQLAASSLTDFRAAIIALVSLFLLLHYIF